MERFTLTDRIALYGGPAGLLVTSLLHPTPGREATAELAHHSGVWLAVHVVQLALILGMGVAVRRMLTGLTSRPAAVARAAAWPFVVFYGAYDALVGLGVGVLAVRSQTLDGAAHHALIDAGDALFFHPIALLLAAVGIGSWLVATLGAAWALREHAPAPVGIALVVAGVLFGLNHVGAVGFLGAGALLVAAVLQRRAQVSPAVGPNPMQPEPVGSAVER